MGKCRNPFPWALQILLIVLGVLFVIGVGLDSTHSGPLYVCQRTSGDTG